MHAEGKLLIQSSCPQQLKISSQFVSHRPFSLDHTKLYIIFKLQDWHQKLACLHGSSERCEKMFSSSVSMRAINTLRHTSSNILFHNNNCLMAIDQGQLTWAGTRTLRNINPIYYIDCPQMHHNHFPSRCLDWLLKTTCPQQLKISHHICVKYFSSWKQLML